MAFTIRSIDQIFTQLLIEKSTLSNLDDLITTVTDVNSLKAQMDNGTAPEWVMDLYTFAVFTHEEEVATQTGFDGIASTVETQRAGTPSRYIEAGLKFQYGDPVILDPISYFPTYEVYDESKQIIGTIKIKPVGTNTKFLLRGKFTDILTQPELDAFSAYLTTFQDLGLRKTVQSLPADLFAINMTVIYNGLYELIEVTTLVEGAINEYLDNDFEIDGKFVTNALVDKLQALTEIIDPQIDSTYVKDELGDDILFGYEYLSNSGYGSIDPAFPLSATITYISR